MTEDGLTTTRGMVEVMRPNGGVTTVGIQNGAMMRIGVTAKTGLTGLVEGKIIQTIAGPKITVLGCQEIGGATTGVTGAGTEMNRAGGR